MDPSSITSDACCQAVVKTSGGLSATQRFARYYALPAYQGSGNVDQASSYVGQVSPALEKPIRWLGQA